MEHTVGCQNVSLSRSYNSNIYEQYGCTCCVVHVNEPAFFANYVKRCYTFTSTPQRKANNASEWMLCCRPAWNARTCVVLVHVSYWRRGSDVTTGGRTLSSGMFCCALFLNLPIVIVKGSQGDDIMQQAVFEVPVLKEPLIAIRISLNKRLRNIGWFLAFASRSCLLTSEVWSPIIIYPPAPHSWQLSPWRGLNAGATHWLHQSVRNCNIKNNNWYSGGRLLFEYFL